MDSWLGFFIPEYQLGDCRVKSLIILSFLQKLKTKLKHFCKTGLCKMFKARQDITAADGDGVQSNFNNQALAGKGEI